MINENYKNRTIIHILINDQLVHRDTEISLVDNIDISSQCLEVRFITLSNNLILTLSKILQEYQIKISKFVDGKYVKNFFKENELELSLATHRLINGYNDNEVILVSKRAKNQGFFEKFFNFFN